MTDRSEETDRILGITRCAECGHRLDGEEECPFCAAMRGMNGETASLATSSRYTLPLWIYLSALLMTFPLSLPWLITNGRMSPLLKVTMSLLGFGWLVLIGSWFI